MRLSFCLLGLLAFSVHANAEGRFNCNGSLPVKWTEYYCVGGTYTDKYELKDVYFGTCEGSQADAEDEPVEIVDIKSIRPNTALAASSAEWKKALAYDLSTKVFGSAVLYIKPESFKSTSYGSVVRLKITEDGKLKDLKLKCGPFN